MATTSLWAVKGRIDHLVNYIENPEKTRDDGVQALQHIVGYTTNTDKTEQKLYVDGINCLLELAVQEMAFIKKHFRKEDGRLAYHGYLSFKPGEVTPDKAHKIGLRLARAMWGDRYQIVVATHLDCTHIHCHFAINSVSFVDGKKYDRTNAEYDRMMSIADMLCREQRLSVIENPQKSKTPREIHLAEKRGEPTRYNVFRQAIDRAIAGSMIKDHFVSILKAQGFEINLCGKYWTIKIRGDTRPTRLYRLGEQYTNENITKRIYERKRPEIYIKPKPVVHKCKLKGSFRQVKKLTGFRALYFHYLYLMGKLPKNNTRPPRHPILWEDIRKLERYTAQITLLCTHKIDTSAQLQAFVDSTKSKMDKLIRQRTDLQNKLRRMIDPEAIVAMRAGKAQLTAKIKPLRNDLKNSAEIVENTARMKERTAMIRSLEIQDKQKQQQKYRKRERGYVR